MARKRFKIVKVNIDKQQLQELINNFINYLKENKPVYNNTEITISYDIYALLINKVKADNVRLTASQKKLIVTTLNQNNFGKINGYENYISDKKYV
jgi:hypothetical protein